MERQTRRFDIPFKRDGLGVETIRQCGLRELLQTIDNGVFGTTTTNIAILEALAAAFDAAELMHQRIIEKVSTPPEKGSGVTLMPLTQEEQQLAGLCFMRVFCHRGRKAMAQMAGRVTVEGALSEEGMMSLAEMETEILAKRVARILVEFLGRETRCSSCEPVNNSAAAARTIYVFLTLLSRCIGEVCRKGRVGKLASLLKNERIVIGDEVWMGATFTSDKSSSVETRLRPVTPDDIVGNQGYLRAALRLARDVAGFDFEAQKNPKQINPILFALGRPGCGKTLAAHAVGNAFLAYCKERDIPAKFIVIRKSDWASSYQNASAANLVNTFNEMHRFDGVTGIYWADIDTALASRDQRGLRSEEKSNLSAAFNIFDGTLIPFDGKWFMLSDANNLSMDEALRTRIAKSPFYVKGPETPSDYVRLLRDILLREHAGYVSAGNGDWERIGRIAHAGDISGRGMEGISRHIIDRIQDFEYPDAYYEADYLGRLSIIKSLSRTLSADEVSELIERYISFEKQEEERQAAKRFEDAVQEAVFAMNVQKEVVDRFEEEV